MLEIDDTHNLNDETHHLISTKPKKPKELFTVKSGLALSSALISSSSDERKDGGKSMMVSRTARVLLAGAGFMADAYDLFVINMVLRLLRDEHPQYVEDGTIFGLEGMVASSALFGAILGQLSAGNLADVVGRKMIFLFTALLITFGNIGAASCTEPDIFNSDGNEQKLITIYHKIAFFRFFLGVGVGGEYPLAATVTSESSSAARRGTLMASVFSMQGVGSLLSVVIIGLCLGLGCSNEFTWRFALGFGALPSIIAFPWRLRMHETESFQRINKERATGVSKSRWSELKRAFQYYKWHVLGTSLSWFLLDVVFYANGLFNHDVTKIILSHNRGTTALEDSRNAAILCVVAVPGYLMAISHIEAVGRKNVQILGFIVMSVIFLICGTGHDWFLGLPPYENSTIPLRVRQLGFLLLYALTFFFSNFGPNTTTFLIPGEIYPIEVRASCHGFSAAMGKFGAAIGASIFPVFMASHGLAGCMHACSFVAILGALITYFFIPQYGANELEDEGNYIPLEFECIRPSSEEYSLLGRGGYYKRMQSYEMPHIIDYSNAGHDWMDMHDAEDIERERALSDARRGNDMYSPITDTEQNDYGATTSSNSTSHSGSGNNSSI